MKEFYLGETARKKILEGSEHLTRCVGTTYGKNGRNVMIYKSNRFIQPRITKDGVSVSNEVIVTDNGVDGPIFTIHEAAQRTAANAGDGTTATIIMLNALLKKGFEEISNGTKPRLVKDAISFGKKQFIEELQKYIKTIENKEEIRKVANISANGDESIVQLVVDTVDVIGNEGLALISPSPSYSSFIEPQNGLTLSKGFAAPGFINDMNKMRCVLKDVAIFIHDERFATHTQLTKFLENFTTTYPSKALVIIASGFSMDTKSTLVANHRQGKLNCCAIEIPEINADQFELLTDLAKLTGGEIWSNRNGYKIKTSDPSDRGKSIPFHILGFADQIIIDDTKTIVSVKDVNHDKLDEYIQGIEKRLETCENKDERKFLNNRVSNLRGKVARVFVGGQTEVEIMEKKDRVEDAIYAVQAALREGIVPGGATMFNHVANQLEANIDNLLDGRTISKDCFKLFIEALKIPLKYLLENGDLDSDQIISDINSKNDFKFGYDLTHEKIDNLLECGILDPALVVKEVIKNSCSIAETLLTTDVIICDAASPDYIVHHDKPNPAVLLS